MARQKTQVRLSGSTPEEVRYIQVRWSEGFVGHKDKSSFMQKDINSKV